MKKKVTVTIKTDAGVLGSYESAELERDADDPITLWQVLHATQDLGNYRVDDGDTLVIQVAEVKDDE